MTERRATVLVFAILATISTSSFADEWTRFHGKNGLGESDATTIPVTWTANDYNWRVSLPGQGHSSPVIWKNRVFLMSAAPDGKTRYALCIDTETGNTVWMHQYSAATHGIHSLSSYASTTPAVDEDHVYMAWATPEETILIAYNHAGDEIWRQDLGPFVGRHGFGTSPIVYDDLLILSCQQQATKLKPGEKPGESFMYAFDRKTGTPRWKTPRVSSQIAYSVPSIYAPAVGPAQLICCSQADGIYSLDPKTGEELWSLKVFDKRTVSSPIVVNDLIVCSNGSGQGGNYAVAIRPGNPPKEVYRIKKQAPYVPTSVPHGDLLFLWADNGIVTCIESATGEKIWQKRVGGNYYGSPIRIGNCIYSVSSNGEAVALAAGREYKLLGRMQLGEISHSTPAVSGGRLYLRTLSHLISIGGKSAG